MPGQTYRLHYVASNNASFGDSARGYSGSRYGSYIVEEATTTAGSITKAIAQDILATWNSRVEADGVNDGSHPAINDSLLNGPWKDRVITFTATSDTAYWIWNMSNASDSTNNTTKIRITDFHAVFASGGTVTYHKATSNAAHAADLTLTLQEEIGIQFLWDNIDNTGIDLWYPVDEQAPVAGDSYAIAFEPAEGFIMAETVTVIIDDKTFIVRTDGQFPEDETVPVYDPIGNILTIPAELLTPEAKTVRVIASAVEIDPINAEETNEIPDANDRIE